MKTLNLIKAFKRESIKNIGTCKRLEMKNMNEPQDNFENTKVLQRKLIKTLDIKKFIFLKNCHSF